MARTMALCGCHWSSWSAGGTTRLADRSMVRDEWFKQSTFTWLLFCFLPWSDG
jgi:hypothetical protein